MPRTIQFHLDEHVSAAVAKGLRRFGIDVTTTPDAGLMGALDRDHLAFALAQNRFLYTQDKHFLKLHASGIPHAGIAYCRPRSRQINEIVQALVLIWEVYEPSEMRNHLEWI